MILKRLLWDVISIPAENGMLDGFLFYPDGARGIVLFAPGSGSNKYSDTNTKVAQCLASRGIAAMTLDLLSASEEADADMCFNIRFLASRLERATSWVRGEDRFHDMHIGYFGSSTGAAAALFAAARLKGQIGAIVSRGGRVDLAGEVIPHVVSPTLFIVGQHDATVLKLNDAAFDGFKCEKSMEIIPDATQLFEEPGKLELVAEHALDWFNRYLVPPEVIASKG